MPPPPPKDTGEDKPLRVRRGRVESVDLYEIKDSELDILEKGSPSDLQLNFAIFLLSIAVSGTFTLGTATFSKSVIQTAFLIVTIVGYVLGVFLLIYWWRTRTSVKSLANKIRRRIKPDPTQAENQPSPPDGLGPDQ